MSETLALPACGIYRTTADIEGIPPGRLVYFHNHGEPGPGLYLPEEWIHNRARFGNRGRVLKDPALAHTLEPLLAEGLYHVTEPFTCCAKECRTYAVATLVQLGYNATAAPIIFLPQWSPDGLMFPERGHTVAAEKLDHLAALIVAHAPRDGAHAPREPLH